MKKRLNELSQEVAQQFVEIDRKVKEFELASGVRCRSACGECCQSPNVVASTAEMLPVARKLIAEGSSDNFLDLAQQKNFEGSCVFYESHSAAEGFGRCTQYENRPALCRLFGFSGRREKKGQLAYISCHWHKKLQPEIVEEVSKKIEAGQLSLPILSETISSLQNLNATQSELQSLPINRALASAIEKLKLSELEPDEPPNTPDLSRIPA